MEKYFFINHIVFGKFYFYTIFTVFVITLLIFIFIFLRYKKNFSLLKERFLTAVLIIWLVFALILISQEVKWLAADFPALINKSQIDKVGYFYNKFANDGRLMPFVKFIKENVPKGSTAYFVSPSGFEYTFARYYLYPEIKIIKGLGSPDFVFLYRLDPALLNANQPLEIYKSLAPDENILKIKL